MSQAVIRSFLENRLKTWADGLNLPVAYENVAFDPADGTTYLAANLLPATTTVPDLQGKLRSMRGVFQVSIRTPSGSGAGEAQALAQQVVDLFPANDRLSDGNVTVLIAGAASIGPGRPDENRYQVPVSIPYRAEIVVA